MKRILAAALLCGALRAETGHDAWLRYTAHQILPQTYMIGTPLPLIESAGQEWARAIRAMTGQSPRRVDMAQDGTVVFTLLPDTILPADAYQLLTQVSNGRRVTWVSAQNDRGVMYGMFALLRKIQLGESIDNLKEIVSPHAPLRWVNQWDNIDGSIERGYGGRSIFWDNGHARSDLTRVSEYARLLASVGINGCSINNVNANPKLLSPEMLPDIARIADAMRPWGVKIALSIDFGSPMSVGGLATFDPEDARVVAWWKGRVDDIYRAIPDFGGFVLKADSEGRVGPSTYGRTHADAANVVARALKPHGGVIFYRGFVYDHHMDWNNPKNDRARAAYDNFKPLDGKFDDNVIVQIKNGPIDFQVREPASPLFGALDHTNEAIELQITQEYFGQAHHTVFLVPYWKSTLDFDMHAKPGAFTPVKSLVKAFVGVANVGLDDNWTGNHLSQANLYGFGRLAWNPDLSAQAINDEWTKLTFGNDPDVLDVVSDIQLTSWRTYENYTGPLGLQTLTDITGNHYGVNVEASERNGWGQWHRADSQGVGMDRTVATGTGYTGQYSSEVARVFENLADTPDDIVLFFHHVPYNYRLHSGKTVIQTIYDMHYDGQEAAEDYGRDWSRLEGEVDKDRYQAVLAQLRYQAGQAEVWRDAVNTWFLKTSGIPDAQGRVGHDARIEAESMILDGYTPVDVTPLEDASRGKAVSCPMQKCSASYTYHGEQATGSIRVEYFDQSTGSAHYRVFINDRLIDEWTADMRLLPGRNDVRIDSTTSTRHDTEVSFKNGDVIRIEGIPDGRESAAIDYVQIFINAVF